MTRLTTISLLVTLVASVSVAQHRDRNLDIAMEAARLDESSVQLTPSEVRQLRRTERALRRGSTVVARDRWASFISSRYLAGGATDINAIVQWVLRESYLETTEDLRFHAEKVRYFNDQKKKVRELLEEARACRWVRCSRDEVVMARIKKWEEELNSVGEDAQLANLDLQNVLQQQQQTLQTISNVSKMLHDTAKSVIRKIGG